MLHILDKRGTWEETLPWFSDAVNQQTVWPSYEY